MEGQEPARAYRRVQQEGGGRTSNGCGTRAQRLDEGQQRTARRLARRARPRRRIETFCLGIFYFTADRMGFTNDSNVHVREVPLTALREIAKNAVYGADKQAFHLRLTTGTNYNFVAVNDQLQFGPSDPIIIGLLSHVKK